jgi:cation:H+ antiporter
VIVDILIFAAGLVLIVKGGGLFVSASVRIAEFLRVSRVVIGSTLVSLATTSPELVVSVISGLRGEPGLAIGNAVGSCICNIGLILGVMAALKHIDIHLRTLRTPMIAMFAAGVLLFLMTLDLGVSRFQGGFLLLLGAGYFIFDFRQHLKSAPPELAAEAQAIEEQVVRGHGWLQTRAGTAIQFLIGAVMVVIGSRLLVDAAVDMATALGVPTIIIGLTVVAIGTSLPELATAISSSRQNVSDLAIGNVLGANVANLTLIIGSAAAIHPVQLSRVTQLFNFPALLMAMTLLLVMVISERRITRREGVGLLSFYGLYLAALVALTLLRGG